MSESTIADFVARFLVDSSEDVEPVRGRVLLSQKRLVLASDEGRAIIPLRDVFDVVVGHVPIGLTHFFDDAVAIAYTRGIERLTAIVEADGETIRRFRTVLFRALLRGATVRIKHPARVGGRYTNESARKASLHLVEGAVRFEGINPPLRIELSDVTHYRKTDRTINGRVRPALNVQFTRNGEVITSEIVMASSRRMNLLGRYLRLEYSELVSEIRDVELSAAEIELLTAVYSGTGDGGLAGLLGLDPSGVTMLLNSLEEKRLIMSNDDGTQITPLGRLAVSERVEHVNA
jgi:helix-turn-helix protein